MVSSAESRRSGPISGFFIHVPRVSPSASSRCLKHYPCKILFIHRDAEKLSYAARKAEILEALPEASSTAVCVVPVRMQETWLLFDTIALRKAAQNPNGDEALDIPKLRQLEELADPKETVHNLLRQASGLRGRHLKKFPVQARVHDIVDFMDDFSPLLTLNAFAALDQDVRETVQAHQWDRA